MMRSSGKRPKTRISAYGLCVGASRGNFSIVKVAREMSCTPSSCLIVSISSGAIMENARSAASRENTISDAPLSTMYVSRLERMPRATEINATMPATLTETPSMESAERILRWKS